jgi:hypothetical protein
LDEQTADLAWNDAMNAVKIERSFKVKVRRFLLRVVILSVIIWPFLGSNNGRNETAQGALQFPSIERCQASPAGKYDYDASGARCVVGTGECGHSF